MSKRPAPDPELTGEFHRLGLKQGPWMPWWLAEFDEHDRPCGGQVEVIHLLGRQEIRNSPALYGLDDQEAVAAIEWDHRNAMTGCTVHHRPFDSHSTPGLVVPGIALPERFIEFVLERGLEADAERKFTDLSLPA